MAIVPDLSFIERCYPWGDWWIVVFNDSAPAVLLPDGTVVALDACLEFAGGSRVPSRSGIP